MMAVIASVLSECLREVGWTPEMFAAMIDVKLPKLQRWLNAKETPPFDQFLQFEELRMPILRRLARVAGAAVSPDGTSITFRHGPRRTD